MDGPSFAGAGSSPQAGSAKESRPGLTITRREAWNQVQSGFERARAGAGAVVLIEAQPGFGKTNLIRAARDRAAEAGLDVLAASGRWAEREFDFSVVVDLYESKLEAADATEREWLLSEATAEAVPIFTPGERGIEPTFEVLHGLYRLSVKVASRRPLAILVDNVDLADAASLRFLAYLIERIGEEPIALVLTAGTTPARLAAQQVEEIVWHPLTSTCRLAPLSEAETATQVRTAWPEAPQEICGQIHQEGGGNPLLVDLITAERARPGGDAAPVIAAWARRVAERLHPDGPALLSAMAVLGPDCELRHVATLAAVDADAAATVVDLLTEAGLLRAEDRLSFEHPAVASSLAATLETGERGAAHLAAARVLGAEDAPPEIVGGHLLEASRTGSSWAVDALCRAAGVALARGAPREAVLYLRRALTEPPKGRQRSNVVLELGRAEALAGEPQAAVRLSEAARWAAGAREEPAKALATARALFALGRPDEAMSVLEGALAEHDGGDSDVAERLRAAHVAAQWLTHLSERVDTGESEPPQDSDTPGARGLLAVHAMQGAIRGVPCAEVRDLAERALARGALLDDETADGLTYYLAAAALAIAEELQTAEAALTAAVAEAQTRGSVLGLATASHVRAMAIMMRGRVLDAAADARNALAAEPDGWRIGLGGARVVLAVSALEAGDLAMTERHLGDAEAVMGDKSPLRISLLVARGRLALAHGHHGRALENLLACGELAGSVGGINPAVAPWRSTAAYAYAGTGDLTEATRLAEEELGLARAFGAPGPIGRALRALGTVSSDPAAALDALEEAVRVMLSSQAALERARALVDFGAALRRSGRVRDARGPLREGLELAHLCGARALAERATTETTAAGARPRRTALTGPDSLTTRERQVAELAGQGFSNREIAEELVVTVKTVEYHLRNSYRKLSVESRAGLRQFFGAAG